MFTNKLLPKTLFKITTTLTVIVVPVSRQWGFKGGLG